MLKDKEAGLSFNWRNRHPLKYPLAGFFILSLIAHFLFFQLFQFPEKAATQGTQMTGSLLLLRGKDGIEIQRLLANSLKMSSLPPRGPAEVDPVTKGIDDQLYQPLTAGVFNWRPKARPYPDTFFEETGTADLNWSKGLPNVDLTFLAPPMQSMEGIVTKITPRLSSVSPELKAILGTELPSWTGEAELLGESAKFLVMINRSGEVILATPLETLGGRRGLTQKTERWIRNLPWKASPEGAKGIISVEWEEVPDV